MHVSSLLFDIMIMDVLLLIICLCQINQSDCKNGGPYIAIRTGKSLESTQYFRKIQKVNIGKTLEKDQKNSFQQKS